MGRKRAEADDEDDDDFFGEDRASLEKDLVRLRDREDEKYEHGTVGADGRSVPRRKKELFDPTYGDSRRGQGQPLLQDEEGGRWDRERVPGQLDLDFDPRGAKARAREEEEAGKGWWASLRGRVAGREGGERGFYQLEREDAVLPETNGRSQEPPRFAPPSSRVAGSLATSQPPSS